VKRENQMILNLFSYIYNFGFLAVSDKKKKKNLIWSPNSR
jgi:hypothetical protein